MSFTKVTSAGIGSTELVTLDSLEVINNASIGGVLTYEDVTNVDSIGIITARAGVLVGSGITLSKDGDIFATGVTTSTTFVGALTGTASLASNLTGTPNISCGTIAGSTGTFSGAVSGTTGTFSGDVSITDKIVHTGDTDTAIRFAGNDIITAEIAGTETFRIDGTGLKIVDKLLHSGDTDTAIRFPAGDTITAETNGAERLRIASDGQLKQTAASGSTIITFKRSDANTTGAFGVLNFAASDDHSVANIQVLGDGDNEGAHIVFKTTSAAASADPYNAATVERLRITSSGKLGVGNNNPSFLLDLKATSSADVLRLGNTAESNHGNADVKIVAGGSYYQNFDFQASTYKFQTYNGSSLGERLRINASGSLNIGNASGYTRLVDVSNAAVTDTEVQIRPNDGNAGESRLFLGGGGTNQYKCAIIFDAVGNYCRGSLHFCMEGTADSSDVDSSDKKLSISPEGYVTKSNQPVFGYRGSTSWTTISNGNADTLALSTAVISSSHYNTSNYRFTAPIAGYYWFGCNLYSKHASMDTSSAHYISGGIRINGSSQVESNTIQHYKNASDGDTGYFISLLHYLNVNDYTEIVLQASGDDFQYYGAHCYFYGWLVA